MSYVVADISLIYLTLQAAFYLTSQIPTLNLPYPEYSTPAVHFAIWTLYGFTAGLFGTGLWVIAHECGHGAFCSNKYLNHSVGWVLHSV